MEAVCFSATAASIKLLHHVPYHHTLGIPVLLTKLRTSSKNINQGRQDVGQYYLRQNFKNTVNYSNNKHHLSGWEIYDQTGKQFQFVLRCLKTQI